MSTPGAHSSKYGKLTRAKCKLTFENKMQVIFADVIFNTLVNSDWSALRNNKIFEKMCVQKRYQKYILFKYFYCALFA